MNLWMSLQWLNVIRVCQNSLHLFKTLESGGEFETPNWIVAIWTVLFAKNIEIFIPNEYFICLH